MSDLNLNPRLLANLLPDGTEPVVCRNGLTGSGAVVVDVAQGVVTYLAGSARERVVRLLVRSREEFCAKYGTPDASFSPAVTAIQLMQDGAKAEEGAQGWLTYLASTLEQGEEQMSKITAKKTADAEKPSKAAPKVGSKAPAKTAPAPVAKAAKTKAAAAPAPEAKGKLSKAEVVKKLDKEVEGKRPGRPGYGARPYTVLISENPCRPGFCHDQVSALMQSTDLAEASGKLAAMGHTRKLEVSWAVKNGYIELGAE